MYTEAQVVSFGNYLLQRYNVQVHSTDGKNTPIYQREVCDADLSNWKEQNPQKPNENRLPSAHQRREAVWVNFWSNSIPCEVHAVHFYERKEKYDLNIFGSNGDNTRIYNIDSAFISKTK